MALLYNFIARRNIRVAWGDVRSGAAYERARKQLQKLEDNRYHPKNWRPSILAFSGSAGSRAHMAVYANWLCAGRGILSLGQVITGDVENLVERKHAQERAVRKFIREEGLDAFPAVVVAQQLSTGMEALVQCHGLGALRPNTCMFGWSEDAEFAGEWLDTLRTIARLGQSILLFSTTLPEDSDPHEVRRGSVDVWWRGKDNGPLMVMLAHMLVQNQGWTDRKIRLLRAVQNEAAKEDTERHLAGLLESARIKGEVHVIVTDSPIDAIHETSQNSAAVFLGFQVPKEDEDATHAFLTGTQLLIEGLRTVFLVHSAGDATLDA
jgi:hypothetical protein